MQLMAPSVDVICLIDPVLLLKHIEKCARKCYQSEHSITDDSYDAFIRKIVDNHHESTIEHASITIDIICDRGVTHEIVRHRLAAYSQESTRYCNYVKEKYCNEITVIEPFFFDPLEEEREIILPTVLHGPYDGYRFKLTTNENLLTIKANAFDVWFLSCLWAEWGYSTLINTFKRTPQEARSVLPNSLKTSIAVTANLREWRHILNLRCSQAAHPQMREIMLPVLNELYRMFPQLFEDLFQKYLAH